MTRELARGSRTGYVPGMSSKEIVQELLKKIPDEASLADIAQEIEFVAGIREGLSELDQGQGLTAEQLRTNLRSWTSLK